jgi:hypothetical protein
MPRKIKTGLVVLAGSLLAVPAAPAQTSQADTLKRIKHAYRNVQAYDGRIKIEKGGSSEVLKIHYKDGSSEIEGLSGPRAGKKIIVGEGTIKVKVLGVFVPMPTPGKYRRAGGDVGAGYILYRLEEEAERERAGTPIQTNLSEDTGKISITSEYMGSGNYRYKKALVVIDKKIMLPVAAFYDTDGRQGWDECYRLDYTSIRRRGEGIRAFGLSEGGSA